MSDKGALFCEADVRATYRFLAHEGRGVTEVRVIAPRRGIVGIGYFDNDEAFVQACEKANGTGNVYVGIQPRPARFMEQASNRITRLRHGATDDDIPWVVAVVIDIDPMRPKHTAATDDELAKAIERGKQICTWAVERGYLEPRLNMSGNGCQLWFAVPPYEVTDLNRASVTAQLKAFEAGIRREFGGDGVAIDSIYNLSRIIKVIGTKSVKGEDTGARPHRLSACLGTFERREDAKLLHAICSAPLSHDQDRDSKRKPSLPVAGAISERVLGLLSSSIKLTALFEGRGKTALGSDGKRLDSSSSGYDFSLALALASKGVTDPAELATVLWHRPDRSAREKGQSYIVRTVERVLARVQAADKRTKPRSDHTDSARPLFEYRKGEGHLAVEAATKALAADPRVYQRGQSLVSIIASDGKPDACEIRREAGAPVIAELSAPNVWEILSHRIAWHKHDDRAGGLVQCDPPDKVVSAVHARMRWPGVRALDGIVMSPVLRADGTIHRTPGYDPATRLFYAPSGPVPDIPEAPSHADAKEAAAHLFDVVCDFPFAGPAHRAAWLTAQLSPIAWAAYEGGAPLFVFDAHTPGTGKSLLCDVIGLIATGQTMARSPYVEDDDELRKRITAHVLAGDSVALIDNAPSGASIGWPSLDNALTAPEWKDRILGKSRNTRLPLNIVWFCTGNNLGVRADAARRVLQIRLEPEQERPEERTNFTHDPLLPWVRAERSRLLAAALTLLRAYFVAGRPKQTLRPLGSFEAWSDLVRSAVVWVGEADPVETSASRDPDADPEQAAHVQMLLAWRELDITGGGLTAAGALNLLSQPGEAAEALRVALLELVPTRDGGLPTSRQLAYKLRSLKGRWRSVGNGLSLSFVQAPTRTHGGFVRWTVKAKQETSP